MRVPVVLSTIALALLSSGVLLAQSDPFIGTWKLNTVKSTYVNAPPPPRSETRTVEAVGKGAKISLNGVNLDGSRIAYSYTTNYDGRETPVIGEGVFFNVDTIAIKRVDAYTFTATTIRAGKVMRRVRGVVSKDGKITTLTARGTDGKGRPATAVTIWEKQ
ncbi:MAG TPA: hypothetical protein VGN16_05735 [Acidobacteriaceae bacterium]